VINASKRYPNPTPVDGLVDLEVGGAIFTRLVNSVKDLEGSWPVSARGR
jgi:hypothetical protein